MCSLLSRILMAAVPILSRGRLFHAMFIILFTLITIIVTLFLVYYSQLVGINSFREGRHSKIRRTHIIIGKEYKVETEDSVE